MAEFQELMRALLAAQNFDGGWSYGKGKSWTEPTAFGVLALPLEPRYLSARQRGVDWLLSEQRSSGGWSPNSTVAECTSVTSLATLALLSGPKPQGTSSTPIQSAVKWTVGQVYPDDMSLGLLLAKALNLPPAHAPGSVAWYPGTAGWVTPTALSAIALLKAAHQFGRPELKQLALRSCSYLASRRCVDHGWNHGGSKTRSEDATSYPETTGLALFALRAASISAPEESLERARQFATRPESIEGLSWLQLAMPSIPDSPSMPKARTTRDCALRLITLAAREGNNVLLESA